MKIFDCFPFYNELDVLEIRLHELAPVVDKFVIVESSETYGGMRKPLYLQEALSAGRFREFRDKIVCGSIDGLKPACTDRVSGREREAYQRNMALPGLISRNISSDDFVIFSDCDEIPSAFSVANYVGNYKKHGIHRFKQRSFYYTVNRLADYGHDFASRARIGMFADVERVGGLYNFRMAEKNTETNVIENGGWHFGYFGGVEHIKNKVATMSPFLNEYKLFGDEQLVRDMIEGKDLHHRRCELPETFTRCESDDPTLPAYYLANRERFKHFTEEYYLKGGR